MLIKLIKYGYYIIKIKIKILGERGIYITFRSGYERTRVTWTSYDGYYKGLGYNRIEFEQFIFPEEEQKIIGRKAPIDLFDGKIKAGEIYKFDPNIGNVYWPSFGDDNGKNYTLPKEICETWEPVYEEIEEKFEVGDWVVFMSDKVETFVNSFWSKDRVLQIDGINGSDDELYFNEDQTMNGYRLFHYKKYFRKAIPEEIIKAKTIVVGGKNAEYILDSNGSKSVRFGCCLITENQIRSLLDIYNTIEKSTNFKYIVIKGYEIDSLLLKKILSILNRIK
jgi:hypothetical protein